MHDIPYDERPYRPCVGIFLINDIKQVFGGRRIDSRAEAWQLPQGGIDPGETAVDACTVSYTHLTLPTNREV